MTRTTSSTERTRVRRVRCRGGFTLVEAMIASTLLAVSVVAIAGAISASYAQDVYAAQRQDAIKSGAQLLNEVTSLPFDTASASSPSLSKYNNYVDEAPITDLKSVVATATNTATAVTSAVTASTTEKNSKRTVRVTRKTGLNGTTSSTGDFAIVDVAVTNGAQQVKMKRLVTSAEAAATR